MTASDTPRLLFLSGAPRSGTTWTQLLVGSHPDVATVQETHLFAQYLGAMERRWRFDTKRGKEQRAVGLPSLLERDEFVQLMRRSVEFVVERAIDGEERPAVVLMKDNDDDGTLLPAVVPDAWHLHAIRDPRAVVASIHAAGKSFGRHWAPGSALGAAEMWADSVRRMRALGERVEHYREVRYEDLHERGAVALAEVYEWLALDARDELCREIFDANRMDRLRGARSEGGSDRPWNLEREPEGFFRKGVVDSWRDDLSEEAVALIEWSVGDLMDELGYARELPRSDAPPAAVRRHRLRRRVSAVIERLTAPIVARVAGSRP